MSPTAQLTAFAQSIYLTIKNRYFDDITGEDGQVYLNQVIDWTNMFVDELENEVGPDGKLVDWWFTRSADYTLGTAAEGARSIVIPTAIDKILTDEKRYVQIVVDGTVISSWAVVHPKDMSNATGQAFPDLCSIVGNSLAFNRSFKDTEAGGTIQGDVTLSMTRMSLTNVKLLSLVKPKQLLILGVAKNATLPDIVQGGLSPSYVQKFNDLLTSAITRSAATSQASVAGRDDYSGIGGVY